MISAVISTRNRRRELHETLLGIKKHHVVSQIVVVDNSSTDDTADMVRHEFPEIDLLLQSENHPIRGYNAGFSRAKNPYVWVMDDDAVPCDGTLDAMVAMMERNPECAAAAGNILRPDGRSEWEPLPQPEHTNRWYNLIGCGFLVRKKTLNQTGGYAENFDLYYNDLDLALRILALGGHIVFRREWKVDHRAAPSAARTGQKNQLMLRNFCLLARSHFCGLERWDILMPHLIKFILLTSRSAGWAATMSAVYTGLTKDTGRGFLGIENHQATPSFREQYALSHALKQWIKPTPARYRALITLPNPKASSPALQMQPPYQALTANRLLARGQEPAPRVDACPWGALAWQAGQHTLKEKLQDASGAHPALPVHCSCHHHLKWLVSPWPSYERFLVRTHFISCLQITHLKKIQESWLYRPVFSIITPIYRPDSFHFSECIASIEQQIYPFWEWCVVDDGGGDAEIISIIESFAARHPGKVRFVIRKQNSGIARSSQEALEMSRGDFVLPLDHDDRLAPQLLHEAALHLNRSPDTDFIYADCDKISPAGERWYHFLKPDWSPELLLSFNYMLHPCLIRRSLALSAGGYRDDYEGSQDYDLYLRVTEQTRRIHHIPKVLYSWRQAPRSTALDTEQKTYVYSAGIKSVTAALARRGLDAVVRHDAHSWTGNYRLEIVSSPQNIALCLHVSPDVVDQARPQWQAFMNQLVCKRITLHTFNTGRDLVTLVNRLITETIPDQLWLADSGVCPGTPVAFERLSSCLHISGLGAISPKITSPRGEIDHLGIALSHHAELLFIHRGSQASDPGYGAYGSLLRNVAIPSPVFTMFSSAALKSIAGMSDQLESVAGMIVDAGLRLRAFDFRIAVDGGIHTVYDRSSWWDWPEEMHPGERDFQYIMRHYATMLTPGDPFYGRYFNRNPASFALVDL